MIGVTNRARLLGLALLTGAAPVLAQQAPAGAPKPLLPQQILQPPATPAAPPQVVPPPVVPTQPTPVPTPVALPVLSPKQAQQLADILRVGAIANGLRHDEAPEGPPLDNDALVRAALDYARAVHSGRLAPEDFDTEWGLRPDAYDPLPGFVDAVKRDRLRQWDAALAPPYAGYDYLRKALATYRQIEAAGGWQPIAAGPDLTTGATGPRVAALRARLAVEDSQTVATGNGFDAALKDAVVRAQRRYGLNPTGVVSKATLAALNVPVSDRVRQIMANIERWRWVPEELPTHRIQVNIAGAVLTVFEGDAPVFSMKAVTGRPGDETPMLASRIHSIVLNPPWNVPSGIAAKELLPKGPAYLAKHGFRVIKNPDGTTRLQQASEQSALGKYKFDFNNPFAVYLHDTPTQRTFSTYSRLESHGCVRLEKPADLARLLLKNDAVWTPETLQAAVDTGKTQRVQLTDQVAVYLLYWTAYADANGTAHFLGDPYGWDKSLASKIEHRSDVQQLASR